MMKAGKVTSQSKKQKIDLLSGSIGLRLSELEQYKQTKPDKFMLINRTLLLGSGFASGYLAGSARVDTRSLIRLGMAGF